MKRFKLFSIGLFSLLFAVASCSKNPVDQKEEVTGKLMFKIAVVPANVVTVVADITNNATGVNITVDPVTSPDVVLSVGNYTIDVYAYDVNTILVYRGSAIFDIIEGSNLVDVIMDPVTGGLTIGLTWN